MSRFVPWLVALITAAIFTMVTGVAGAAEPATRPITVVLPADSVDKPMLFVHLPKPADRSGAAIVICPGGGYAGLTMGSEGNATARWFADRGIAGIVLRYRLPGKPGHTPASPLEDAHAAMIAVRDHAAAWGIDPHRVGILGFSAGGHVASSAGTHFDASTRPDFMLLLYPVITMTDPCAHAGSRENLLGPHPEPKLVKFYSSELQVTKQTPPTFIAAASDDRTVNPMNSVLFYEALLKAGVPAELHMYTAGDHGLRGGIGWGIGGPTKSVSSTWPDRAMDWMKQRGIVHAHRAG